MSARTFRKFVALFRRRRLERELAEEIETHRTLLAASAGAEASRIMGNVTLAREESREVWSFRLLEWVFQDARLAMRGLRRSPVFTAVAIASLALGIGANTALFSFVNAILLKKLPVPEPDRLVTMASVEHGQRQGVAWRLSDFEEVAARTTTLDGIFGWFSRPVSLAAGDAQARWVHGEMVTGQYFRTMRVQPAAGRLFDEDDVRAAAGNPVCVLSYALWQSDFGGRPDIVGRSIQLNGHSYRVLGVTERGFIGAALQQRFDVAIPATRVADFMPAFAPAAWLNRLSFLAPMARLKSGVIREQAAKDIDRTAHDWRSRETVLEDGSQGFSRMRAQFGEPVLALMAVSALVLLVACANLANLLLARAQARAKEFSIRLAIGASRGRLVRQLLVESLALAVAGGAAGVALALWINRTLIAFLNGARPAPYALHFGPDWRVLAFSVVLSLATAVLFGWAPAWQATRVSQGRHAFVRAGLVVFQIALSLVIVFAAGLLTRTLRSLATVDLGYQPDRVIELNVDPAASGHSGVEVSAILDEILARARELPGVKAASLGPPSDAGLSMTVDVPGYAAKDNVVFFSFISPDYFATLGQPLLLGRDFAARDTWNSPHVAIVNEKFVRHYLNSRDPVGIRFSHPGGPLQIVGVVADTRDDLRKGARETVFLPEKQSQTSGLIVFVRTPGDPRHAIPSLLGVVQRIDPRMPVYSVRTMDAQVEAGLSSEKILGLLSSLFAALATLLAGIGLYGVIAYSVTRRRREIGIRFAVGAQRADVAGLFARESLALVLAGLTIGAPVALVAARALRSLLFGVTAADPATLAASVAVLALAAVLATSMPLWRAAKLDPMVALRHE